MGNNPSYKTPVVESGGSSFGKKGVCDGIGTNFIDIGNASSRMKLKELEYCDANGISLTEIKVGYDGIVLASAKAGIEIEISRADLGKALTARVPNADNTDLIDNPYNSWADVNPSLPDIAIRVYGPPTTSGTRASFAEMVNEKGYCKKDVDVIAALKAIGEKAKNCRAIRTDGAYVEAGEQDNLIVQKLQQDPNALGIFGFSYLDQNSDTLKGAKIDGVVPTFDAIADGDYTISRALYFYVKHEHLDVIPGMKAYLNEWTKHWDEEGILAENGMIPLSEEEAKENKTAMRELPKLISDMLE
jgi:phosphate transport system substrate-binding protein